MLTFLENGQKAISKLDNGNTFIYERHDGVYFDERTPQEVIKILCQARRKFRDPRRGLGGLSGKVRIHYGDQETGRDWMEENDVRGYISNSAGPLKIPILLERPLSDGGSHVLDHCIVKIRDVRTDKVLYQHPRYHYKTITAREIKPEDKIGSTDLYEEGYRFAIDTEGDNHANFRTLRELNRFLLDVIGHIPKSVETKFIL